MMAMKEFDGDAKKNHFLALAPTVSLCLAKAEPFVDTSS